MTGMFRVHDFREYDLVTLDASCFLAPEMESSLLDGLRESRVYVSATFEAEATAYKELFPVQHMASYKALISHFPKIRTPDRRQSTWEMICNFASAGRHIAVVTGNRLLIERIILEDAPSIHADIYNLFDKEWIPYGEFQSMREVLELVKDERSQVPPQAEAIGYGTPLYPSSGGEVYLSRLDGQQISGTESQLFGVENENHERLGLAKIFRTGNLTPGKCEHLQQMKAFANTANLPWCLFPKEILYRDESRQIFAGILEDYAADVHTLYERRLYHGDLSLPEDLSMKLSDNLRVCYYLVRQVCYLNNYGFFISDFNLKNFALRPDDPEHILMFDTDSFGYGNFFSGFRAAGSSTANRYDTTKKTGALEFCEDSLHVAVFSLLSLGSPPIYAKGNTRVFRFDENIEDRWRKNLFPEKLWSYFESAFRARKFFSAEMLLLELSESLKRLKEHPEEDLSYGSVFPEPASDPTPVSPVRHVLESGAMDRVLLFLSGFAVVIILYILYRGGFLTGLL